MKEVTITLDRYDELIKKEIVYDILKGIAEGNPYATSEEKRLFGIKDSE